MGTNRRHGASSTETAVILVTVAVVLIGTLAIFGPRLATTFGLVGSSTGGINAAAVADDKTASDAYYSGVTKDGSYVAPTKLYDANGNVAFNGFPAGSTVKDLGNGAYQVLRPDGSLYGENGPGSPRPVLDSQGRMWYASSPSTVTNTAGNPWFPGSKFAPQ